MFKSPAASAHMMPLSTRVPAAEEHFLMGLQAFDAEKGPVALQHFKEAIKADPSFAVAHLYAAFTDPGLAAFKAHLDQAVGLATKASPAEQLLVEIAKRDFANDENGRLEAAQQLVRIAPSEPRGYLEVARAQFALNKIADGRSALIKAIELAPDMTHNHAELANSYIQLQPYDYAAAETHLNHALSLEPSAAYVHDYLGDLHRARNELEKARSDYTKMAELDPLSPTGVLQRGFVNAFLGNYAEARADYDRAVALAAPQLKIAFLQNRAVVSVYAGDPATAERDLADLLSKVETFNGPDPIGSKIAILNNLFLIASHSGHFDVAQSAVDQLTELWKTRTTIDGSPTMRGIAVAAPAYAAGLLAIRKGDFATGRAKAKEYMSARQGENNPRKNEGAHGLLAMADLMEGHPDRALQHFAEIPVEDFYMTFYRAVALEKTGKTSEAKELFRLVAQRNFYTTQIGLVRKEAAAHLQ
jgi:Flp pilus assembly protein TadD